MRARDTVETTVLDLLLQHTRGGRGGRGKGGERLDSSGSEGEGGDRGEVQGVISTDESDSPLKDPALLEKLLYGTGEEKVLHII